jgi:hypothetical protein
MGSWPALAAAAKGNTSAMTFMRGVGPVALVATMAWAAPSFAQSQTPALIGEFGDWSAYTYPAGKSKVCYVVSSPKGSDPRVKRDPIFFLVTHRPGQGVRNEVSTIIGYPFKKDTQVSLRIDEDGFKLFTNGDGAWAESKERDKSIVGAMRKGKAMKVSGTSWRGTSTTDTYSLKGISDALEKIDLTCK